MAAQALPERLTGHTVDSKLIKVSTLDMSKQDWLKFRNNGIGGSDIATIMGLNKYKSSHQLFYEKVEETSNDYDNIAMFMGRFMEDHIAELWSYWDGDVDTLMSNYENNNPVRKCRKQNSFIINPDYPFLFASVDRIITKGAAGKEGILEIKTISGFTSNMWIAGIPPQYIVQLQQYLLVTGLEYGEMAILKDGRYPEVYSFERNDEIMNNIVEQASAFWDNVLKARELYKQGLPFEHLEPEIDNTEAYAAFLNEKFKATPATAQPDENIFKIGLEYMACNDAIKQIENDKEICANSIKEYMGDASLIDFGINGKITWAENAKGNRVLNVKVKQAERIPA